MSAVSLEPTLGLGSTKGCSWPGRAKFGPGFLAGILPFGWGAFACRAADITLHSPLMSPVAFALNTYLAEGAGANLVQVAGAEFD